jgi:hypothetical protein
MQNFQRLLFYIIIIIIIIIKDSVFGIVTGLWAGRSGVRCPADVRNSQRLDWLWRSPGLLLNGNLWLFPRGKAAGG